MKKPKLNDLICFRWRDSFTLEEDPDKWDDECIWYTVGFVTRMDDTFLYTVGSQQETHVGRDLVDHAIAVPWTQILELEVIR